MTDVTQKQRELAIVGCLAACSIITFFTGGVLAIILALRLLWP